MRITSWLVLLAIALGAFFACDRGSTDAPTEVPGQWQQARMTPGHSAHVGKMFDNRAITCGDCHEEKEGFKSPGAAPCTKCHEDKTKRHHQGSKEKPTTCLTCHVFSPADGGTAPTCADCHKTEHARHTTAACTSCHAPHGEPKTAFADCTACHTGIGAKHGSFEVVALSDAGDAIADAAPSRDAAITANPANAATHAGVCSACHAPHAAAADAKNSCATCHVATTTATNAWLSIKPPRIKPAPPKVASHEACTTCHAPHAARADSVLACDGCHGNKKAVASVVGHGKCTGCHQPHAPNNAPLACEGCHKNHDALGAVKIPAHDRCTSCHAVHAPATKAATACVNCHGKIHPNHPPAKDGTCVGCHVPHPAASGVTVATCTSCHKIAATDHKLHAGVVCTKCHQQHDFKLANTPSLCASCHAGPAAKVLEPGHASCTSCHGAPHTPSKDVACGKCHGKETSSAPKGHKDCRTCHESHGGALFVSGKATTAAAICSTCHADKTKTQHGALPGGCASCHRPHGPSGIASPPACTSCHAQSKLPGLHASPAHAATCTNCHGGHTPTHADRATCTGSCHANMKNHQPAAKFCTGCHIFTK
jgi:hypothetical protein